MPGSIVIQITQHLIDYFLSQVIPLKEFHENAAITFWIILLAYKAAKNQNTVLLAEVNNTWL